jgi:4-amino-4-deoxy-L-arabinose transferase-like glycosyltransferase
VAAGVIWGLACLTRPALLLFPLVLLAYWMLFGRDTKKIMKVHLAVLAGLLISWTPWQIYSHDDKPKKYSPSAVSFALGGYPDLIYKSEKLRGYPYREDSRYGEISESLGSAMKVVWERAKEKPATYLRWYLTGKPLLYWNANVTVGWGQAFVYKVNSTSYHKHKMLRKTYEFMMKYHMVFAALALLFSVIVSVRTVIRKNITSEMFIITSSGLLLIYFTIIHMILAPLSRYSIPLYPICYMLAIAALQYALIAGKRLFKNTKKVTI